MGHKGGATITKAYPVAQPVGWSLREDSVRHMPNSSESLTSDSSIISSRQVKQEKGKPVDGDGADFADRRFVQGRPTAFFMNQHEHRSASWGFKDKPTKPFDLFMAAQSMIARNQIEFDRERGIAQE